MIPMYMRLKVRNEDKTSVNLYIPLLLIYILLLPLLLLALPFVLIWYLVSAVMNDEERRRIPPVEIIPALFLLLTATGGTEIEVRDGKSEVILKLI